MNKIYEAWLNNTNVTSELKHEMLNMDIKDIEYSFTDEPLKFGTAGYRNKIGPGNLFMNVFTYQQLAVGYATFVKRRFYQNPENEGKIPTVVVAHDARRGNIEFTYAVVNALTNSGVKVLLFDDNIPMFTPIVSFTIRKMQLDGGINITASHNPKNYNGFKAYNASGGQLLPHECEMVSSFLQPWDANLNMKFRKLPKLISHVPNTVINAYFENTKKTLINDTPPNNELIIFTPHHGVGCAYISNFLKSLGHHIIDVPEQNFYSSEFVNSPLPNPEDPASFALSLEMAKEKEARIMIAIDPDGDRFAIAINHQGIWRYLNGNETGILLTHYILSYKDFGDNVPVIVSTHVSNNLINKLANEFGALVLRTGTGFKFIAKAMDEIDDDGEFVVGFEEAIGACTNVNIREKDGIGAAALVLEMVDFYKAEGLDLIDVLERRIYPLYGAWQGQTFSITIPGNDWKEKAKDLENKAMNVKVKKIGDYIIKDILWNEEGSCIEWMLENDSWIKFRISGTEPKFKIYTNIYFQNHRDSYISYEEKMAIINQLVDEIKETFNII